MTTTRPRRRATLALAAMSILTFGVADANLPLLILAIPAILAGWFLTQPPLGRPLPRIIINLMLVGILAYTLFMVAAKGFTVSTVCEIITLTLIAKVLDRRSERDQGQVISISVFLCIGTILTSNGFWVGMLLIGCLALLVAATVGYQIDRVAPGPRSPGRDRVFSRQRRRLVGVMFVAGLIVSVVVFLTVPRKLGAGLFGEWGNPGIGQVTGFADEVELGTPGIISQSSTPVLDLEVLDPRGQNLGGPGLVYYLRGAVLEDYTNGRWERSNESIQNAKRNPTDQDLGRFAVAGEPRFWTIEQHITVRNSAATRSHLFAIWRPVILEPSQPSAFRVNTEDGTIVRESSSGMFEYTVLSRDFELRNRYEDRRSWSVPKPIASPNLDLARFEALARRIMTDAGLATDPATRPYTENEKGAAAIRDYFATGFEYTLEAAPVPPRRDPTEWFLFDRRAGHCEYYASAMATLCRSVGINARVITGYVATEYNEATSHYVVRQSNAHAWVEAEVGPGVWYTFDPTPTADFQRVHEPSQSWLAQARRLFDAAEYAWIRAVVGYDADRQSSLIKSAFNRSWQPDQAMEDLVTKLRTGGLKFALKLIGVMMLTVSVSLLVLVLASRYRAALAAALRRVLATVLLSMRPGRDLRAIYQRFLKELALRGSPKPAGVPLLTHVRLALAGSAPDESAAGERLARSLYRARFDTPTSELAEQCARDLELLRTRRGRPRSESAPGGPI